MKQVIFTNWTFMRFLRLGLGIAVLVQAIVVTDTMFALLGILFTAMPVFNIGCCGTSGCDMPPDNKTKPDKEIRYEEVA